MAKLLLYGSLREREDALRPLDAVAQTVVLNILLDNERDSKHPALAGLLLGDLKAVSVPIPHDVTGTQLHNVADAQAQVALQYKGRCYALIGSASAEARPHGLDDLFILLRGERLGFLVHIASGSLKRGDKFRVCGLPPVFS